MTRPKFGFPETLIDETLEVIKRYGINSSRKGSDEVLPDPKDIVFYEVTLSVNGSYLVKTFSKEAVRGNSCRDAADYPGDEITED